MQDVAGSLSPGNSSNMVLAIGSVAGVEKWWLFSVATTILLATRGSQATTNRRNAQVDMFVSMHTNTHAGN